MAPKIIKSDITGSEALFTEGRWTVLHDPKGHYVWCCEDGIYAARGVCRAAWHRFPAKLHRGPVFRYAQWWRQRTASEAFDLALAWIRSQKEAASEIDEELYRRVEIEHLVQEMPNA